MTDSVTNKIILSADSTCDLDQELKERYHVHYFPLHIILDGKDYRDGIDITPEEIYQKYYDEKILPKTAAVNVAEYIEHFKPWVDEGYEVIHINLGSSLSSAHQNCCIAAEELGHVHVIDSCSLHRNRTSRNRCRSDDRAGIESGRHCRSSSRTHKALSCQLYFGYADISTCRWALFDGRCSRSKCFEIKAVYRSQHSRWQYECRKEISWNA